jgi:hypothetical protein
MTKVYNNDEFYKGRIYTMAARPLGIKEVPARRELGLDDKPEYFLRLIDEMVRDGLLALELGLNLDTKQELKRWTAI